MSKKSDGKLSSNWKEEIVKYVEDRKRRGLQPQYSDEDIRKKEKKEESE